MTASSIVIPMSGGLDSMVVAALAFKAKVTSRYALFVDYGQRVAEKEREAARAIARAYGMCLECVTVEIPFLAQCELLKDTVIFDEAIEELIGGSSLMRRDGAFLVPYRNFFILSLATSLASIVDASEIWVGFDFIDGKSKATDKSPGFVSAINDVIEVARPEGFGGAKVVAPLQGMTKAQVIRTGEYSNVSNWSMAWSCYNNLEKPCGVCGQCISRINAFKELDIPEGVEYHSAEYIRGVIDS